LAAWADIEARLLDAVLRCFSTDENGMFSRRAVAMGFVSLQGFKNKLLFAGATLQRALSGSPHADDWAKLREKLSTESVRRNHLAHFQTLPFPTNTDGRRIALCPWSSPKGGDKTKPPSGSYCLLDLAVTRQGFVAADCRLANFVARICNASAPFAESDEQPDAPRRWSN
jgi:hypothetical protein